MAQADLIAIAPDGAIRGAGRRAGLQGHPVQPGHSGQAAGGSLFKLFVYLAALERGYTPHPP